MSAPTPPRVVVFATDEAGHMSSLLPVVAGLVRHGASCTVFAPARDRTRLEAAGARFVDLFDGRPLAAADDASSPFPCRYVSFAGRYGDALLREVEALGPDVIVNDSFAVVARAVAGVLRRPWVPLFCGHDVRPAPLLAALRTDPRVAVAPACHDAVEVLRRRFHLRDASPFSYVDGVSPFLNLCAEPRAFVGDEAAAAFAPAAYVGCLPDVDPAGADARPGAAPGAPLRVLASFGTVVGRYFRPRVLALLGAFAAEVRRRQDVVGRISLGGLELTPQERRALDGVRVDAFVDQRAVLPATDVLLTHHGLHSTHEAIWSGVPMIGHPFFWDQPALAARCRDLGVSVTLAGPGDLARAIDEVVARRDEMAAALARVRAWEAEALACREAAIARILRLGAARGDA